MVIFIFLSSPYTDPLLYAADLVSVTSFPLTNTDATGETLSVPVLLNPIFASTK